MTSKAVQHTPACPHTWNEGNTAFGCVLPLGHKGDHSPFQFASGMYSRPVEDSSGNKFGPLGPPQHLTQKLNDLVGTTTKAAQHTSGPWDVNAVFICQSDGEALHFSEYIVREFGGGAQHPIRSREEAEANARLISAAPDLLEALEAMRETVPVTLSYYEQLTAPLSEGEERAFKALQKAEAAIQKARGGP